jgi:hypothetical protein
MSTFTLPADSTFVAEFEVAFSSYEAIKNAVAEYCQNDYKIDPVEHFEREYKMHELHDSCIVEYRNCAYMIKPVVDAPTTFLVSAHTYFEANELESFKACLSVLLKELCESLTTQYQEEIEEEEYKSTSYDEFKSETEAEQSLLSEASCFVENYEITFTSYEDIKRELDHYIGGQVVSQDLPNLYIAKGRINVYMITPFPDEPTKFLISAFTYNKVRYGCSFWDYIEHELELLCEYLERIYEVRLQEKEQELENDDFIVPADHLLAYTEIVDNFTSPELVKDALKYAINCSYNQRTSDEPYITKEVPDSCIRIRPFVNEPTKFKIYLYQPKNDVYINPKFTSSNLLYYLEDFRDFDTSKVEAEAYYDKQFEEYLRLNPVSSESEEECPPLSIATAESVARANEILSAYNNNNEDENWIDKYIEANRIQSSKKNNETQSNPLVIDEDIYVYDGIDIYE